MFNLVLAFTMTFHLYDFMSGEVSNIALQHMFAFLSHGDNAV